MPVLETQEERQARLEGLLGPTVQTYYGGQSADGPKSALWTGVHGDERAAIEAGRLMVASGLVIDNGIVDFVYEAFPNAVAAGERFVEDLGENGQPIDADGNRMFQDPGNLEPYQLASPAFRRSLVLARSLDEVDALLDGHNTSNRDTTPITIAEPHTWHIAAQLPIKLINDGFDRFEPGGTDYGMNQKRNPVTGEQKIGICTEAGYQRDPDAVGLTQDIFTAFLLARDHIDLETVKSRKVSRRIIDMRTEPKDHKRVVGIYLADTEFRTKPEGFSDYQSVELTDHAGMDGQRPIAVGDADTRGTSWGPGQKEILFASSKVRIPGQTGFLVVENMPQIVPASVRRRRG